MYYIFYAFVRLLTLLPLRMLYVVSDFLYIITYKLIGYRKQTVRKNLSDSFPDKTSIELLKIEKKFYRYFCDLIIETIKQLNISDTSIKKLIQFTNSEYIYNDYKAGRSVFIMTSHYGNWELCATGNLHLPDDKPLLNVYKTLKNANFDKFMLKLRGRYGGVNVDKNLLIRKLIELKRAGKIFSVGMISDQSPRNDSNKILQNFLGRETWFFSGTEILARKFAMPVYYAKIKRLKRGSYICEIIPICTDSALSHEGEITGKFAEILQQQILDEPEYWLWTHNRWK